MANGFLARLTGGLLRDRTFQAGANISITNPAGDAGDPTFALTGIGSSLEAWDADLDAIAALSGTGIAVRTAANTWAQRSLANGSNISISNADGVSGNPSIAVTGIGSTIEGWDADLDAIAALSSTGIAVRSAANTWVQRGISGGTNIAVVNPDGVAGNPTIGLTGVVATANGGTSVDIASAALPLGSGQITFPATMNPSANVNTLDDYEEGTWTPVLQFGGSNAGITYSTQTGVYVKVGRIVFISGRIDLSSKGAAGGAASIAALPFSEADGFGAGGIFNYYSNFAAGVVSPQFNISGTTMNLTYAGAGTVTGMANTDFNNNSLLIWSGFYRS